MQVSFTSELTVSLLSWLLFHLDLLVSGHNILDRLCMLEAFILVPYCKLKLLTSWATVFFSNVKPC